MHCFLFYRSGVGTSGALQALYYCEVKDDQKTDQGKSNHDKWNI